MDQDWLSTWRVSVTALLAELMETFKQRFGFEPGTNELRPPASREAVASLAALRPPPSHDLLTLYRNVGEVSLPDVGNGYFIHSPRLVIQHKQSREPRRMGPPIDVDVLAFASGGGGALYVLPAADAGPVYRLQDCAIRHGVADARGGRIVAKDLREFLQRLEVAVKTYAVTGKLTDL